MAPKKYEVRLSTEEKRYLRQAVRSGRSSAQAITRARILLKVDEGWNATQVATALDISERGNTSQEAVCARGVGADAAPAQPGQPVPVSGRTGGRSSHALACTTTPEGHDHWILWLLAGKTVKLGLVESPSHKTVRLHLKKTNSSRGGSSSGAFPR